MAIDHRGEDAEIGPTYKSITVAACGVLFAFIGWWATDIKQSVTRLWERLDKIDGRTATLEAGAVEHRYQYYQLQQEIDRYKATVDANTKIIREMERLLPRR